MVIRNRNTKVATPQLRASNPSTSNLFGRIQKRAYELYEKRGYSHGNDWNDWLEAERQVKKEFRLR